MAFTIEKLEAALTKAHSMMMEPPVRPRVITHDDVLVANFSEAEIMRLSAEGLSYEDMIDLLNKNEQQAWLERLSVEGFCSHS